MKDLLDYWPVAIGLISLIIVLAKMHNDIKINSEKIKTLFDLYNK